MKIYVAGADRTSFVSMGTLSIEEAINERSVCSFSLIAPPSSFLVLVGDKVEVKDNDVVLFGGSINDFDKSLIKGSNPRQIQYDISVADYHQICDRRIVAEAFSQIEAGKIVEALATKYLMPEGISVICDAGQVVIEAVFNYVPLTTCLDKLCEITGFNWWITPEKVLYFKSRDYLETQEDITENSPIWNVKLSGNRDKFRNRQYIKAGKDITDMQIERFKGDGSNKTFTVGFPLAITPTLMVNDIQKAVGIKGVSESKDWYWNKGDAVITQDSSATPLTINETLTISYQGMFDIVAIVYDDDSIEKRKQKEGGSGFYDDVEEEPQLTSRDSAFQSASTKLRRYAKFNSTLSFSTFNNIYTPGQIVRVNLGILGAVGLFLVQKKSLKEFANSKYAFDVFCVAGEAVDGWVQMFKGLTNNSKTFIIRENITENQVLVVLENYEKIWQKAEPLNILKSVYPSSTTYPTTTTFPMFEEVDKVKYIAWLDELGVEVGRKALTKQIILETEIVTTFNIATYEANTIISMFVFVGGWQATQENGSGIIVDYCNYGKEKNQLESIQVIKTDIKGW